MRVLGLGSLVAMAGALYDRGLVSARSLPSEIGPLPPSVKFSTPVPNSRVTLRSLIRVCPGGAHGIFWSDIGEVRKPFDAETITWQSQGTGLFI